MEKALTDHEKTLIGTDSVKKLQNARKALTSAATTPSTGDSIQIALWAALLFISGSGLLGVAYRRKSKRVEN